MLKPDSDPDLIDAIVEKLGWTCFEYNQTGESVMDTLAKTTILINQKPVLVECTRTAIRELSRRTKPLVVELELYFSCLVKKFVHFHEALPERATTQVSDKLELFFRPVTSTACTFEVADRLGRQPEIELETPNVKKIAPSRVRIDFVRGAWKGDYWI